MHKYDRSSPSVHSAERLRIFFQTFDTLVESLDLPVAQQSIFTSTSMSPPAAVRPSALRSNKKSEPVFPSCSKSESQSSYTPESSQSQSQSQSQQSPMHVTQIGYIDVQSFDYSPIPASNSQQSITNANSFDGVITRTGTDQMAIIERRRQIVEPLHKENTPLEEPPLGSNTTNHLRRVLENFAEKIVANGAVIGSTFDSSNSSSTSNNNNNNNRPKPSHFGMAEKFIRTRLQMMNEIQKKETNHHKRQKYQ
jgi:hypothetical protein